MNKAILVSLNNVQALISFNDYTYTFKKHILVRDTPGTPYVIRWVVDLYTLIYRKDYE